MSVQVTITAASLNRQRAQEGSAFTATANFYTDAFVASAPTSASYRIDRIRQGDPSTWQQVADWTTLTPATSISIPITATHNAIQNDCTRSERRQITVKANVGLSTQTQAVFRYSVENLAGQS